MPAVLVTVYTVMQYELAASLSTSSIIARHLLDFMQQQKITEAGTSTICLDTTLSGLLVPPPPSSPHFYAKCSFRRNPPNLSWLGTGTE